jgi:hypothetical protein
MGNLIGFTKSGKVSVRHVWDALNIALDTLFPEVFDAVPLLGTGIHVICRGCPDLQWEWWQDGNRVWGKYPHYGDVAYWVHGALLNEVGSKIRCKLVSEGTEGTWSPDPNKYKTFREYFVLSHVHMKNDEARAALWLEAVKQIPPPLVPFAGDTGPLLETA